MSGPDPIPVWHGISIFEPYLAQTLTLQMHAWPRYGPDANVSGPDYLPDRALIYIRPAQILPYVWHGVFLFEPYLAQILFNHLNFNLNLATMF